MVLVTSQMVNMTSPLKELTGTLLMVVLLGSFLVIHNIRHEDRRMFHSNENI